MRSIMSRSSVSSTPACAPSATSAFSSSSVTTCGAARCQPNSHITNAEDAPSNQTIGPTIRDSPAIGPASRAAICSGRRSASCFGTSSPSTRVRYVVTTTTTPSARGPATAATSGNRSSHCSRCEAMRAPPNTPVKTLTRVMPTCTVGRKRCGSSASRRALAAPARPLRSSTARRARRAETRASSLIANTPFSRISSSRSRISRPIAMARAPFPSNADVTGRS